MNAKRLATIGVLLLMAGLASAQSLPNYARGAWITWNNAVVASGVMTTDMAKRSDLNFNGKSVLSYVIDSARVVLASALKCTIDFNYPIYAPFICASAAAVTGSVYLAQDYGDTPSALTIGTDTMAFGFPGFGKRFVFSVAAADTPCSFFVMGTAMPGLY